MTLSYEKCQLLWKLCRKHGWGTPVPKDVLVDLALKSSDQGRGKDIAEELVTEPYIGYQQNKGYSVKNDPDSQAKVAFLLVSECGYNKIQVEATLSRFKQAGGFDAYDEDEVLDDNQ
jgi:hypothetical protein